MLAIMMVLLLPPSESCRMRVSFESLQYENTTLSLKISIIIDRKRFTASPHTVLTDRREGRVQCAGDVARLQLHRLVLHWLPVAGHLVQHV